MGRGLLVHAEGVYSRRNFQFFRGRHELHQWPCEDPRSYNRGQGRRSQRAISTHTSIIVARFERTWHANAVSKQSADVRQLIGFSVEFEISEGFPVKVALHATSASITVPYMVGAVPRYIEILHREVTLFLW